MGDVSVQAFFVAKTKENRMDANTRWVRVKDLVGDRKAGIPAIIPISRAHWLQLVKDGKAPAPVKLSERCTVWKMSDVLEFIASKGRA